MSDASRDSNELRREVLETRNQIIKTENQVKNLSLDIKNFERRFDQIEQKMRFASLGAQALIALVVIIAVWGVHRLRLHMATTELQQRVTQAVSGENESNKNLEDLRARLAAVEQERSRAEKNEQLISKILDAMDNKREEEALKLLESVNEHSLPVLSRRLLGGRFIELRRKGADNALKQARAAQAANQSETMLNELRHCLALDPDGRNAAPARYLLGAQLWSLKRFDEAEPILRELLRKENDKALVEEVRFYLATALVGMSKRDEAKKLLNEVVQKSGRFVAQAKDYLAALDAGTVPAKALPKERSGAAVARRGESTPTAKPVNP